MARLVANRSLARRLFERNDFMTKNERAAAGPFVFSYLPPAQLAPDLAGVMIAPAPPGSIPKKADAVAAAAASKRKLEQHMVAESNKRQQLENERATAAAAAAASAAADDELEEAELGFLNQEPAESDDSAPSIPPSEEGDDEGESEGGEGKTELSADLPAWNKLPIAAELKKLIPPAWWKPAKASAIESKKSVRIREHEELTYASVPLIPTDKARRVIVATNSMPAKAITWPKSYMPDEELKTVKADTHLHSKQLYKLLKTELPAVINRDADVFGVVLTLLNAIDSASPDDVKHVLTTAVLPLLIDNNMRTSDVLQRLSLELFGIKPTAAPTGKGETVNASSYELPLLRYHLDSKAAQEKMAKSLFKVTPTAASTGRSSSFSSNLMKKSRGTNRTAQFTGPATSRGRGNWNRGRGSSSFARGGSSRGSTRGSRGGRGRGNSSRGGSSASSPQDF